MSAALEKQLLTSLRIKSVCKVVHRATFTSKVTIKLLNLFSKLRVRLRALVAYIKDRKILALSLSVICAGFVWFYLELNISFGLLICCLVLSLKYTKVGLLGFVVLAVVGYLAPAGDNELALPATVRLIQMSPSSSNENELVFDLGNGFKAIAKYNKYQKLELFSRCNIDGRIAIPSESGFNYRRYLRSRDIDYQITIRTLKCTSPSELNLYERFVLFINQIKHFIISKVESGFHEPYASLLVGIMLGQERVFSEKFEEALKVSGTTHVISASGYNLSVLIVLLRRVLFFITRNFRIYLTIGIIWSYAIMASLSPSIVRAALMSSLALFAVLLGRQNIIHLALPISCALFVIVTPEVVGSMSFLLSVLSTAGIIYVYPVLNRSYQRIRGSSELNLIEETGLVTLSCTLAVLLLSALSFGQLSVVSLVVNIILLPILSYVMPLGFLWTSLVTLKINYIDEILFRFINSELVIFTSLVERFSEIEWASLELGAVSKSLIVLLWVLLVLAVFLRYEDDEKQNFYIKQFSDE